MRPPYGATSAYINHWMNREFGMKVILWSVDPLDWKYRNSARVESQILAGARPGAIILSHAIAISGKGMKADREKDVP